MLRYLVTLVLLVAPSLASATFTARQTDWMGGPGVLGPVSDWATQYWMSDSVTTATPGQVSLIATSWNYLDWVKHVVESNPGILPSAQGFMPADIDGDRITDLVAHTADWVVWYKHDGFYNFTKHTIGPASSGNWPCVYPCDLDQDGDIDVLVAGSVVGVGWYENQSLSWVWHNLDSSTGYHRVSATDVELDGDIDVIAVNGDISGDIYLFRNNGSQIFVKELAADLPASEGWRVYPQDFNNDGYPDLYSVYENTYIFLNDSTGHFTQSFYGDYWAGWDFDGAWPSDIDMDGDVDLIGGNYSGHHAWLNDGAGTNFTIYHLHPHGEYLDGTMALDLDLDGLPDIAGTYTKAGWFRQDPSNPLTFILYEIDVMNGSSHWLYADKLCENCIPSTDLLVTEQSAHIVYENQMLEAFATLGYLESSILEFSSDSACTLKYFGYNACVPNDTALSFYWRAGLDSADLVNNPWNGPYPATMGMGIVDSFSLAPASGRMFQYKSEFRSAPDDIAVLYEVWVEAAPLLPAGLVTGGGWIPGHPPGPGNKRTFGFNVHSEAGVTWGQLQFNDHGTKMRVHSDTIKTLVVQPGDTIANFSGDCRVDGLSGYTFECEVEDRGEPGHGVDWFSMDIYDADGSLYYRAGDFLGGGNIQIHAPDDDIAKSGSSSEEEPGDDPSPPCTMGEGTQALLIGQGLSQNSPNPFTDRTTITFHLPASGHTSLEIHDITGRLVATLVDEKLSAGAHSVAWERDGTPSGIYFYRLQAGDFRAIKKMVVLE